MPMNRVQLNEGLSFGEFRRRYGTEDGCEQRWPGGFECPALFLAAVSTTPAWQSEQVCRSRLPATGEDLVVFRLNSLEPGSLTDFDWAPSLNHTAWNRLAMHRPVGAGGGKQAREIAWLHIFSVNPPIVGSAGSKGTGNNPPRDRRSK
ncbi:hypothetical protein [Ideonella sp.]|uniref:hypothetical protein n=1 Tax=Ideonella sp. TaxID=1929293 RepID=UPI0035AF4E8A